MAELIVNGAFENFTGDDPDNWTVYEGGASTITEETTIIHGGSSALKIAPAAWNYARVRQDVAGEVGGNNYDFSVWYRQDAVGDAKASIYIYDSVNGQSLQENGSWTAGYVAIKKAATTTYTELSISNWTLASGGAIRLDLQNDASEGKAGSVYFDDCSLADAVSGYTLTCDGGSYALTGQAVNALFGRLISMASGSYALTGQDASLHKGFTLVAAEGSYLVTGQAASLLKTNLISIGAGNYVLTGQDAGLRKGRTLQADAGSYAITGQVVNLKKDSKIAIEAGEYLLSGQAVGFLADRKIAIEVGGYDVTGQALSLLKDSILVIGPGSYVLTGSDVTFDYSGAIFYPIIFDVEPRERVFDVDARKRTKDVPARTRIFKVKGRR
jgi:hypothetical protein